MATASAEISQQPVSTITHVSQLSDYSSPPFLNHPHWHQVEQHELFLLNPDQIAEQNTILNNEI